MRTKLSIQAVCRLTQHGPTFNTDVGTPSVTNLTFDRVSRTLTCTSTGGPATNVTWRKDGVAIVLNQSYEQTQMITDTMSGTYQNVLTIALSVALGSTYSCSVESIRGSSNTRNVSGNNC